MPILLNHKKKSWKSSKTFSSRDSNVLTKFKWEYLVSLHTHFPSVSSFIVIYWLISSSFTQFRTRILTRFPGNRECVMCTSAFYNGPIRTLITQARPMGSCIRVSHLLNGWSDISHPLSVLLHPSVSTPCAGVSFTKVFYKHIVTFNLLTLCSVLHNQSNWVFPAFSIEPERLSK